MDKYKRKRALILAAVALLILAAVFLPKRMVTHNEDRAKRAQGMIAIINGALKRFHEDKGKYPTTQEGLELLTKIPDYSNRPYLNGLPMDPWGTPFQYRSPGIGNTESYQLWSFGADKKPGGDGKNADIHAIPGE